MAEIFRSDHVGSLFANNAHYQAVLFVIHRVKMVFSKRGKGQ